MTQKTILQADIDYLNATKGDVNVEELEANLKQPKGRSTKVEFDPNEIVVEQFEHEGELLFFDKDGNVYNLGGELKKNIQYKR